MTAARTASLSDHPDWLLPRSDALIGSEARARLAVLSERLPPLARIAVEYRLTDGERQVDLQQCFYRDDYPMLAAHFNDGSAGSACGSGSFFNLLAREGSALNRGIGEIFLEYDLPVARDLPQLPSVFIGFAEEPVRRHLAATALASLGLKPGAAVEACFGACAADAHVSCVGAMLGRAGGSSA